MELTAFLTWLSKINKMTEAQKAEVSKILAEHPAGEAPIAAVEKDDGEDRTC